ncbi:MAG TPA: rhodanese-like domain-containing protein [Terracidiphilus sp.]
MKACNQGRFAVIAFLGLLCGLAAPAPARGQMGSASQIPSSALMQPAELNTILRTKSAPQPLILQVGSRVMFDEAHIPGAEYAGPGSQAQGLKLLRKRVEKLGHETPIVIYCGCCPWSRCPNIWPAYKTLHDMGFAHVQALYLADNFGTDWANKGYPVENPH